MIRSSVVGVETRAWFEIISSFHNFNIIAENSASANKLGIGRWSKRDACHSGGLDGNEDRAGGGEDATRLVETFNYPLSNEHIFYE